MMILKKYFYISLIALFSCHFAYATQVNPQLINPQIGENLWGMNYRQSITQDDILNTVTLCCNCDFFITQDDIDANGGGFTINQPGNWCLAQDIITSQPITISGISNISFDLKGRSISSTTNNPSVSAMINVINAPGTLIKNGTLIGLDLGSGATRRAGIGLSGSADSIIDGVHVAFFASTDNSAILKSNTGFYINQDNTQCINCSATGPFLDGFFINGNSNTITNCTVSHFNGSQFTTLTATGVGFFILGNNNYLDQCTSTGGSIAQPSPASAGSVGFYIQGASNNILYNCVALNHQLSAFTPLGIPGGSGFYVTGDDGEIRNSISAYNALYGVFNTGTGLIVCDNMVNNNVTNYSGTTNSDLCNLLCTDYITQDRLPFNITEPGVYCFNGSLEETTGLSAITIADNIDNVTINCGGHAITRTAIAETQPLIMIGNSCQNINIQHGILVGNGTASETNLAISTTDSPYKNIVLENMTMSDFNQTITLGRGGSYVSIKDCSFFDGLQSVITCSQVSNIAIDSCDANNNNAFLSAAACPNITVNGCNIQGGTQSIESNITCTLCDNLVVEDTTIAESQNYGISIYTGSNIMLSNVIAYNNGIDGIFANLCFGINLDNTITTSNGLNGVEITNGVPIYITGCTSNNNAHNGFEITDSVTISINDSIGQHNGSDGFHLLTCVFTNIDGCTGESNLGSGFHLDDNTAFANVSGCTVVGNLQCGFLSADTGALIPVSPLGQRFHACHAVFNGSVPGSTDYSQANTVGVIMLPPLAGPTEGLIATTPDLSIPGQPLAAADFSTYL